MSYWSDRLKAHPIWGTLDALGSALDEALQRESIAPAEIESLARLKSVLVMAGKRIAGLDAHLVSFPLLDNVSNNLADAAAQIRQFRANGSAGHLNNAQSQADAAIQHLALLAVVTSETVVWAKEAAQTYQEGLVTLLGDARSAAAKATEELGALKTRVAELATEVANEKQRLTSLASDHQAQFSTAQETRRQEAASLSRQHEESLTTLERKFEKELGAATESFKAAIESGAKAQESTLESLRSDFVTSAEAMKTEIDQHRARVEELVGVIGDLGVTSGYKTTAEAAARSAGWWQIGTVMALLAFAGIAAATLFQIVKGEFSWMGLAGRVFISVAFGVLAGYCGAQAEKYQRVEGRNRKLALELAALGPFLAPLPREKQDEFRLSVGALTFGRDDTSHFTGVRSPTNAFEALTSKDAVEVLVSLLKKALK